MMEAIRSYETSALSRATLRNNSEDGILPTKSMAFSPQANYTDCPTAAGQRTLVPTLKDRGVSHGQRGGTPRPLISERSRYLSFKQLIIYPHEAEWTPFQTSILLLRNSGSAGNRTRDLWDCNQVL
jgi:hypothetical protein